MNLEDEILEISRSFQVVVHTARGGDRELPRSRTKGTLLLECAFLNAVAPLSFENLIFNILIFLMNVGKKQLETNIKRKKLVKPTQPNQKSQLCTQLLDFLLFSQ
jgi:hypothetical protein